jgi:Na+-transporting NADH:ubiquinone oxidoreductase subunit C
MPLENFKTNKDSPINTLIIAGSLCLVCALVVSSAASALKKIQEANIVLDRKKNLLQVVGISPEELGDTTAIKKAFEDKFEIQIVDLDTGEFGESALEECYEAVTNFGKKMEKDGFEEKYDPFAMSKTKDALVCDEIPKGEDIAGIKYREKYSQVYIAKAEDGSPKLYVFPVRGYGLWSMMQGFLAVKPDFQTVEGLVFFEQKETPGLGGEVKSPGFLNQWPGKQLYADEGDVQIRVIKSADDDHSIDALSGATITSNGVTNAMKYWMGPNGFKNYIDRQKGIEPAAKPAEEETSANETLKNGVRNG